jgi:adenine deaminase
VRIVQVKPATVDLVIKNGNLVNVHSGKIYSADVAVTGKKITYVGDQAEKLLGKHTKMVDASDKYVAPGLIDTHIHIHETHLPITEFARAVVPHGTTAVVADFYGEGVVAGPKAIKFFLDESKKTPLKVYWVLPLPGYYQNRPFGHTGNLTKAELYAMLDWPECHGVNEIFAQFVVNRDQFLLDLIGKAKEKRKTLYGHASEITGDALQVWLNTVGRIADHETARTDEAVERHRLGIWMSAREGSGCSDETSVLKAVTDHGADPRRFMFCTDVASPLQLFTLGHIDNNVRLAIKNGVDPVVAIQMATINAAEYMRADEDIGSVSPGKSADILLVNDLENFRVSTVISNGQIVAENGHFTAKVSPVRYPKYMFNTVKFKRPINAKDFKIKAPIADGMVRALVIGMREGSVITEEMHETLQVSNNEVLPNLERDILKVAILERHLRSGKIGTALVHGFNLKRGAIGSTWDSQRVDMIISGTNDEDMAFVANHLQRVGGGFVVAADKKVLSELELPILGILAKDEFPKVVEKLEKTYKAAHDLGCRFEYPFHSLGFLGFRSGIGNLRITYSGLVRIWDEKAVDLVENVQSDHSN